MPQLRPSMVSGVLWVFAASCLANAIAMLFFGHTWFFRLVPGVSETGTFNAHLVADAGTFYLAIGAGLVAAAIDPIRNAIAVTIAAVASTAHAILHIWSHAAGILSMAHVGAEVLLIYVPTAILCALAVTVSRPQRAPDAPRLRAA
jgi:hypothetical protein